ncbi:MAG: hypothetical protein DRI84_05355 [Bacteroidetes bacterium]|nr:MAG: hypothetical protein DRI84_05355 [Bacteroidota bacterium]
MRLITISILLFFSSALFAQNFSWTAQTSGVTSILNDVYFTNSQTGWAVGDAGVILNTTDAGQTWLPQASGTTQKLRAVFFINANTGWAVGGSTSKAILKTTNGGSSWQSITAPNIVSGIIYDIAFTDVNTGWLVAFDSIYRSTDGGNTWVGEGYVTGVLSQTIRNIAVTSDTTAFVGGSMKPGVNARAAQVFYRRPDNAPYLWGTSGFDPNVTGEEIMSLHFINSDIGFAGGTSGKLYRKSDYDASGVWYLNKDVSSNASLISAVSFPSESTGMFCAVVSASPSYTVVYHTLDTGDTWSNAPDTIPNFTLPILYAPSNDTAWIVGLAGKIYIGVRNTVSINTMTLDMAVTIYPNPATDIINVNIVSESIERINYTLTDMTGRVIEKGQWNVNSSSSTFTLNIADIVSGVYMLQLNTDKGQRSFRVIKN